MQTIDLVAVVSLLICISLASERLVEIVRNLSGLASEIPIPPPILLTDDPVASARRERERKAAAKKEEKRKATVQLISIISGLLTAFLAGPVIISVFPGTKSGGWDGIRTLVVMGIFASGGSALWKEILSYVRNIREIKGSEAVVQQTAALKAEASKPNVAVPAAAPAAPR